MTEIGVCTGCFYQLDMTLREQVDYIRDLGADGIEITFSDADEVMAAEPAAFGDLSEEFSFVTVHAPIRDAVEGASSLEWVRQLERFREAVGARSIVFHPPKLPSLDFITEHARVAIENMQRRKGFDRDDLAAFIDGWDGPLVIDVCHAATWGMDEIEHLFEAYGDRCSHVHASAFGDDEHERLVEHPDFLDDIAHHLAGRQIILENRLQSTDQIDEELSFVRGRL